MGPLSTIYSTALSLRKFLYRTGIKQSQKLPKRVISIGNITLGGTGKTPAVIALAQAAVKRGFKPCILTRGYKGKLKGPGFAGMGEGPVLNVTQAGDEPVLMAERVKGVPVVIGRNRYSSGIFTLEQLGYESIDIFILDDGFQHWGIHRDLDILLIDATNPLGNSKLFPEGILREPLEAIQRTHMIIITKTDMICSEAIKAIKINIRQYASDIPLYASFHKPAALVNTSGEEKHPESLKGVKIYSFAGIANPSHFRGLMSSLGADILKFRSFKDHYSYKQKDIDVIEKEAKGNSIITTEKDFVKLRELEIPENLYALRIEFTIDSKFYDSIFNMYLTEDA